MYPVVIQLDTAVPELFVNMSAQASIVTHIQDSVVLVPTAAVQTQGQQKVVRIMKNGTPQMVIVETGQASDTQVAIISGVQEGDEVVTSVINTTQSSQRASGSQSPFSGLGFGGRTGGFGGGGTNVRISR
jgi:multidrug efflux pump subunit AcrA (membrane-fusion protein)